MRKTENALVVVEEIGNCICETPAEVISLMEFYRDAAPVGSAFIHCTINPAIDHGREALVRAAHRVRLEVDPEDSRPYLVIVHQKRRSEEGGSGEHAHLVLGRVDRFGRCVKDGWLKVRTERVARELEFDLGEQPLIGRHHKSVLRHLWAARPEVAVWLESAHGANPPKPESAISEKNRNRARKTGLNVVKQKALVRGLWRCSTGMAEFAANLDEGGLELLPGNRSDVWIIQDRQGRLVGSASRLLRMRKRDFLELMMPDVEAAVRKALAPGSGPQSKAGRAPSLRADRAGPVLRALLLGVPGSRPHYDDNEADKNLLPRTDLWGIGQLPKPKV
jgi:hypothetical protein